MPRRVSKATGWFPMAVAYWRSPRSAATSGKRARALTAQWTGWIGRMDSAGATLAGARSIRVAEARNREDRPRRRLEAIAADGGYRVGRRRRARPRTYSGP